MLFFIFVNGLQNKYQAFAKFFRIYHIIVKKKRSKTVAFPVGMRYNIKAVRRWGGSGTLYLKSAISELNAFLDEIYGRSARRKER